MKIRSRLLVLPATFALLAACDGDPSGGNGGNGGVLGSGSLSFTYAGDISGTFAAEGAVPMQNQAGATWAMAERDAEFDEIAVWANLKRADGKVNQIILQVPDAGAGQYVISDEGESEASVQVHFGLTLTNPPSAEYLCDLSNGTVTVASVSDDEIRGSFSGTAECVDGAMEESATVTITNGQFRTPIYNDE